MMSNAAANAPKSAADRSRAAATTITTFAALHASWSAIGTARPARRRTVCWVIAAVKFALEPSS
jgi:hypothetical protein